MTTKSKSEISLVPKRATIEVHLPDGRVLQGPRNSTAEDFLEVLPEAKNPPIVGAIINGLLRELTRRISMDAKVRPVTMGEADGMRIYRRSLIFLMDTAFTELFPGAILRVDYSIASGGYYCQVEGRPPLSESELAELGGRMQELVETDLPFLRQEVPLSEAIEYFESEGEQDKILLLSHRKKNYLTLYSLKDHRDYHHGYMVPTTGYLHWFELVKTGEGFLLRFPRQHAPTKLSPLPRYPKMLKTFRQYKKWLSLLGIGSVGELNDAITNNRVHEVILVSEALHEQRVTELAFP
jgi:uridine kinase